LRYCWYKVPPIHHTSQLANGQHQRTAFAPPKAEETPAALPDTNIEFTRYEPD